MQENNKSAFKIYVKHVYNMHSSDYNKKIVYLLTG